MLSPESVFYIIKKKLIITEILKIVSYSMFIIHMKKLRFKESFKTYPRSHKCAMCSRVKIQTQTEL